MFIEAELQFRHYTPSEIVVGMLFLNHFNPGHPDKEHVQVWEITDEHFQDDIPHDELLNRYGFPVKPYIIQDNVLITPEEIGTFVIFNDDDTEDYTDFSITEMNFILREFDGWCELLIDEDSYYNLLVEPIYDENNKVTIKFIDEDEYIDDEEE